MQTLKIILLGESRCGKSHLFQSFIKPDRLTADYRCTSGVDYGTRRITIARGMQDQPIQLTIYDPDGNPRYTSIISSYIANTEVAIILCDISVEPNLDVLLKYIKQVKDNNPNAIIFLAETSQNQKSSLASEQLREFASIQNLVALSTDDPNQFFKEVTHYAVLKLAQKAALTEIRDYRQQRKNESENPLVRVSIDSHGELGRLLGKVGISTYSKNDKTSAVDQLEKVVMGQAPCDSLRCHLPALKNGRLGMLYKEIYFLLPEVMSSLEASRQ